MTADALTDRLLTVPFQPFRLRMPDGRALPVPHPDFITIHPEGMTALLFQEQEKDGWWTVDLFSVSDLEPGLDQARSRESS